MYEDFVLAWCALCQGLLSFQFWTMVLFVFLYSITYSEYCKYKDDINLMGKDEA